MYTAKRETGGGIILDASHELDYIRWLLGEVREVFCFAGKLSSLEVETEDTAEIVLRFENGAMAGVHLDFVQRAYSRRLIRSGYNFPLSSNLLPISFSNVCPFSRFYR
jgi:predicted dehydrogenase